MLAHLLVQPAHPLPEHPRVQVQAVAARQVPVRESPEAAEDGQQQVVRLHEELRLPRALPDRAGVFLGDLRLQRPELERLVAVPGLQPPGITAFLHEVPLTLELLERRHALLGEPPPLLGAPCLLASLIREVLAGPSAGAATLDVVGVAVIRLASLAAAAFLRHGRARGLVA